MCSSDLEVASYARSAFEQEKADEVVIFYNHARNSADQDLRQETILPVSPESFKKEAEEGAETAEGKFASSSEFEPDAATVLDHLLPAYVQTMVYHALLDSAAAEQGARRKAMKSATDNASDMIFTLNRMYNRVRQGAITTEITEIVGGAAALEEE